MTTPQPPHRYGFLLFDDVETPETAHWAIAGSKAGRVHSVSELPTDVLWWSNLPYAAFSHPAIGNMSNLRYSKFLTISPEECVMEWGFNPQSLSRPDFTTFVSRLFSRIMTISFTLMCEIDKRKHPHSIFSARELRFDFASVMPRQDYPEGEAATILKAGYSYVDFTGAARLPTRGVPRVMLRRPRLAHAIDMFLSPIPKGAMKFVKNGAKDIHDVIEAKVPMLSEVVISNVNPHVSPVFAYGHSMNRKNKVMRAWVPHPEIISMSAFSEIEVKNTWIGEEYGRLVDIMPDAVRRFLMSDHATLSWSAGLIAETLWRSQCIRNQRPMTPGVDQPDSSWIGAWLKSTDKVLSFLSVFDVEVSSGIPVSSYGFGYGWFSCPANQINELINVAASRGLAPRLNCVPADFQWNPSLWKGDTKSTILTTFMMQKKIGACLNLDRIMLAAEPDRQSVMANILKEIQAASS